MCGQYHCHFTNEKTEVVKELAQGYFSGNPAITSLSVTSEVVMSDWIQPPSLHRQIGTWCGAVNTPGFRLEFKLCGGGAHQSLLPSCKCQLLSPSIYQLRASLVTRKTWAKEMEKLTSRIEQTLRSADRPLLYQQVKVKF